MLAIITYDAPHRKTQDVLCRLLLEGYRNLHLIALPWIARKNFTPIYSHRPAGRVELHTGQLSERLGLSYSRVNEAELDKHLQENAYDHILIAGAGILPTEVALHHKVINAHPGYLPLMRGLDAFKWAIYHSEPIGVTTHYITDKADEGALIERREIPLYREDSFHSLAYRVYETEIEMLVNAIKLIENKVAPLSSLTDDRYAAYRRMPNNLEAEMLQKFEILRQHAPTQHAG